LERTGKGAPLRPPGERLDREAGVSSPGFDFDRMRILIDRAVARTCPGWLRGSREDIVQEAMLRLVQILNRGEHNPTPPPSYLWKVAYTVTIDEIRRVTRRGESPIEQVAEEADRPSERPDPHRAEEQREMGQAIGECLGRLNEARRLVVGLHLFGHSLEETARLTAWKTKTVKNGLYRGLAALRRCLERKGFRP
jgi:RNA polymerase sigma-70 factor (ECF subfamily)